MVQSVDSDTIEKAAVSSGHRSRSSDERSISGTHQGQQSLRTASAGRTHACKRQLHLTDHNLLQGGGHPHMRRREFITLIGGAATVSFRSALAQHPGRVWRIGLLHGVPSEASIGYAAFRKRLGELGYVEGQNSTIDYRWSDQADR